MCVPEAVQIGPDVPNPPHCPCVTFLCLMLLCIHVCIVTSPDHVCVPGRVLCRRATQGRGGPISRLLARKVEVRAMRTTMKPLQFLFAYTNPVRDHDVSASMHGSGQIETEITKVRAHADYLHDLAV